MLPTFHRLAEAVRKPLIRFVGPRGPVWKDQPAHRGPHPLTPPNLEKHVAKPQPRSQPSQSQNAAPARSSPAKNSHQEAIEFSQLPAKYRRPPIADIEIEAIETGGATAIF
ncbi:hypothetical protein BZG36_04034 [Bifiguratus adelaidae]|uniref:Uncharacterized protein n=1 Tax=Bifiguratus adelaidae TaxID=1938954 RepID=A0A261Y070_9FUNG|nr:hypothetical protein BZG36_04034 [Bifiguratus adelaidae]